MFYQRLSILLATLAFSLGSWGELLLGEKEIIPGIILTFEVAPKDTILPPGFYLSEKDTDVHLEVLAVWSDSAPEGSTLGGFVPYLYISGTVINKKTAATANFRLTPHLNLSDNFHYAQNISLPGELDELYDLIFEVRAPKPGELGMHLDWSSSFGPELITDAKFKFLNLNLKDVSLSLRR